MTRDFAAVAQRLTADAKAGSPLLRVTDPAIKAALGASANAIIRWIVSGKRGVFLDGVQAGGRSWSTTTAAASRFLASLSERRMGQQKPLPAILPDRPLAPGAKLGDAIRAMRLNEPPRAA